MLFKSKNLFAFLAFLALFAAKFLNGGRSPPCMFIPNSYIVYSAAFASLR